MASGITNPALITPTLVIRPVAVTKPEPVRTTLKVQLVAVGRLAGEMLVIVALGDTAVTVNVTTAVLLVPQLMVTVPVRTSPGVAALKGAWRNDTASAGPKL